MSLSSSRQNGKYRQMADINVTPFVDVVLVLLVVFMITAPMLNVGVPVDLPKAELEQINQSKTPLVISIDRQGKIYLQETAISADKLIPKLQAITKQGPDTRIFVRGDRNLLYGKIMEVMGLLNKAGFSKVALIAELPQS